MSLKEAVLDIAENIRRDADSFLKGTADPIGLILAHGWADQLLTAVKAAGDTPPTSIIVPPEVQHFQMMQKAREEFRKDKNKEDDGTKMVLLVGGASDGDSFAILSNWPIGARTNIDGEVYQLKEDGKLHFEGSKGK